MKITYVTSINIPSRWAHSMQIIKMAQAFQQIGHEVEMVSCCSLKEWRSGINKALVWDHYGVSTPFRITRIPIYKLSKMKQKQSSGPFSFSRLAAYYAKLKKTDLLFAREYLTPYWSAKMGIPTIAESHSEPDGSFQKRRLFEASKMDSFSRLITISELLAEKYVQAGVPEKKILVEQDGVDLSMFSSINSAEIGKIRGDLLEGRKAVALYAGHLYDYKGIPLILDAAQKLPEISFVLVGGWDKDIERIKRQSLEAGLKNIKLTGFVPQSKIPVYLGAADVLLLPYTGKHFQASTTSPLKLFEYMASGKPIVAAALNNIKNVLVHDKNAVLFEPDNVEEFIERIDNLLSDKQRSSILARQAWEDVQKYDWGKRAQRILRLSGF